MTSRVTPIFDAYYSDTNNRICDKGGTKNSGIPND